ncbi:MAG: hypothetical protein LBU09_03465, partial [Endomicrobium sp.]|nr:hypothetical protein [Endomicrobium sp.]
MRKIFVSVFFVLFAFAFTQTANAVNVSSVSYFQGLYASGGLQTVDMTKSITFSYSVRLGDSGNNLNMTVNLGGYALSFIGGSSPSGNGGQMNVKNSNLTFISGGIMFSANTASSAGGAIYNDTSSTLNFTDVEANFTSNSSVYYGGAIVNYRADINFTGSTVSFANNSVTIS